MFLRENPQLNENFDWRVSNVYLNLHHPRNAPVVVMGIDRLPLDSRKVLLHLLNDGLDVRAGSARRRPEVEGSDTHLSL
jgi:hypothetical protein